MRTPMKEIRKLLSDLTVDERLDLIKLLRTDTGISLEELLELRAEEEETACPSCGSHTIVKNGTRDGIQRFLCKKCGTSFHELQDCILNRSHKDFDTWKLYIKCMLERHTLRQCARECGISLPTAFYWRHKILNIVSKYLERVKLIGTVEMDDTFLPLSYKGSRHLPRKAHKRGQSSHKRGLSDDKVCISCAISRANSRVYAKATTLGRTNANTLGKIMKSRLKKCRRLITDKDSAYKLFAKNAGLRITQVKSGEPRRGIYHVQNINAFHSRLKAFLRKFCGVSTKYLDNYLSWMALIVERKSTLLRTIKNIIKFQLDESWHDVAAKPAFPVVG